MVGNIQLRPKLWHLLNFYICCVCSFQLYMCVCVYLEILFIIFANLKFSYEAPKISHLSQCGICNMNWTEWAFFTDGTTILLHSSVLPCCTNLYAMNHIWILIYCIAIAYKLTCLESCHCLTCVSYFLALFKELCARLRIDRVAWVARCATFISFVYAIKLFMDLHFYVACLSNSPHFPFTIWHCVSYSLIRI